MDGLRGLGGAGKGGLQGLLWGLHCPPGPAVGGDGAHFQADGRGLHGRPPEARSAGRLLRLVLEAAPLQHEMAPPSPAPALYI